VESAGVIDGLEAIDVLPRIRAADQAELRLAANESANGPLEREQSAGVAVGDAVDSCATNHWLREIGFSCEAVEDVLALWAHQVSAESAT
jgi:hypothetical protein